MSAKCSRTEEDVVPRKASSGADERADKSADHERVRVRTHAVRRRGKKGLHPRPCAEKRRGKKECSKSNAARQFVTQRSAQLCVKALRRARFFCGRVGALARPTAGRAQHATKKRCGRDEDVTAA